MEGSIVLALLEEMFWGLCVGDLVGKRVCMRSVQIAVVVLTVGVFESVKKLYLRW